MIRVEAGSLIPYLGFHWDLSSSAKSLFSEADLYNILPNISFNAISARCFIFFFLFDSIDSMGVS
jgi:hypothetical protein